MKKFLLATRPSFLTITLLGCFIGISGHPTEVKWAISIFGTLLALMAHAAANLLNDYHDFLNGTDELNVGRIYPFTGGSRFIQNKELTSSQIKWFSLSLFLLVICCGISLAILTTGKLIWVGIVGISLGWIYSSPPLKLMARGILGEIAISITWSLIVIGTYLLNSSILSPKIIFLALAYGITISSILFINQIPDIDADKSVGKNTLAVSFPENQLSLLYLIIAVIPHLIIFIGYVFQCLNPIYLLSFLAYPIQIHVGQNLQSAIKSKNKFKRLIIETIIASHIVGLLFIFSNLIS